LKLSMAPDNSRIVSGATGYCLVTAAAEHFICFFEDADSVTINLNGMPDSQPIVLVDAKASYDEIDRGRLMAGVHTIHLGPTSDWALAVGSFDTRASDVAPDEAR